jgi:hypothetical protein
MFFAIFIVGDSVVTYVKSVGLMFIAPVSFNYIAVMIFPLEPLDSLVT